MIEISPAVLASSKEEFLRQVKGYKKVVDRIDIDINTADDRFYGVVTVTPTEVLEIISQNLDVKFSLHLMVERPLYIIQDFKKIRQDLFYFVHQEAYIDDVFEVLKKEECGVVVKAESALESVDFYNQFSEVQFMTIETGEQGNGFKPEVLDRVEWLKKQGYKGKISIDGSVNLESSDLIKRFPIDRVSVGSFFSKSNDFKKDYDLLDKLLNN